MHFTSILLHSFGSFADADVGRIKSPSRPKNQNVEYRTLNHHIAMSLNVTFVSVTGCSRDGLDVYRPLAAPPVGAPGRERAEEELLRREAVARPDRHRRRHCRCRLPSNNNSLLPFKSPTRCTVVLTTRYLASLASITRTLPKVNRMWRRIGGQLMNHSQTLY